MDKRPPAEMRFSRPLVAYLVAVWVLAAMVALLVLARGFSVDPVEAFVILSVLTLLGELKPLTVPFEGQLWSLSLGTSFSLAMLLLFGTGEAMVAYGVALGISNAIERKPIYKIAFNVGQGVLATAAAGVAFELLLGDLPGASPGTFDEAGYILATFASLGVFFVVNNGLTITVAHLASGMRLKALVPQFFGDQALPEMSSLTLVPVIAVAVDQAPLLAIILALPIAVIYKAAEASMQKIALLKEKARAIEEKEATEQWFRSLVQNSFDVICTTDAAGTFTYVSPSIARMMGYTAEDLVGKQYTQAFHPDDVERVSSGFRQVIESLNISTIADVRFRDAFGSWRWVELVIVDQLQDPAVGGVVINIRDISDRMKLEEQLRRSQRLEAVGQLAGGVAHDFNNLLSVIHGFTRFAKESMPPDSELHADLAEVLKASDRGARLVQQLLTFSRKELVRPVVLDLNAVVSDMAKLLRATVTEGVDLNIRLARDLPPVEIDRGQLEQVLINLAVNARDAMEMRGSLTIETGVAGTGDEPCVRLTVSDTGCGMDEGVKDRIFEPFFTTKERGAGTGLGLSTVYGIVDGAGGGITVKSEVGKGTSFVVDLPVANAPLHEGSGVSSQSETQERVAEAILVIEDEVSICRLVDRILSRAGYRVLVANSPERGLEILDAHLGEIDVVLTDVVMPGMTGNQLRDEILAKDRTVKIVHMSGYTADMIAKHHDADVTHAYLQKPFSAEQLLLTMREAIDGPSVEDALSATSGAERE